MHASLTQSKISLKFLHISYASTIVTCYQLCSQVLAIGCGFRCLYSNFSYCNMAVDSKTVLSVQFFIIHANDYVCFMSYHLTMLYDSILCVQRIQLSLQLWHTVKVIDKQFCFFFVAQLQWQLQQLVVIVPIVLSLLSSFKVPNSDILFGILQIQVQEQLT